MATLNNLLDSISTSKQIAVVGPNCRVTDDATALYLAARLYGKSGDLYIYDKMPHSENHSHGNIISYLSDMIEWASKIPLKAPEVQEMNMLTTRVNGGFLDAIIDNNTAKCILNTPERGKVSYARNAKRLTQSYHGLLCKGGSVIFIYHPGFWDWGMHALVDELERHKGFEITARAEYEDTLRIHAKKKSYRFGSGVIMQAVTAMRT